MPKLIIDNREVAVDNGATILDAAKKLGIEIPTMCFLSGQSPSTSCMICVVKVEGVDNLLPACGAVAKDGMRVETCSDEVREARRTALELQLSDHVGDCMGPCQVTCPAHMNIPLMIRQIAGGELGDAIATVKSDIALPAVLGRICPAPCEKPCRRSAFDEPVSICLLKRYVADIDIESAKPYLPSRKASQGKTVAIIGAGPAGLAAAYYLQQEGLDCTIFDDREEPGGMLRYGVPVDELSREVLDKEIACVARLGAVFKCGTRVGDQVSLDDLQKDFDAVFVATGQSSIDDLNRLGIEATQKGIAVDAQTYQTKLAGVFAGGDAVHQRRLTIRAVADGKEAAFSICQYLSGREATGVTKPFNSRMGKLMDGEVDKFVATVSGAPRIEPSQAGDGFTDEQARGEAARCLRCDCRKAGNCKLRSYAQEYGVRATRYKGDRRLFEQQLQHPDVIYEPGKCIDCGLCIKIAAESREELGLSFVGRGFDVRVAVPFDRSIADGLKLTAAKCVEACPTAALAFKDSATARSG
ncbi:MAG: (2Fe-2S)-binding protein [Phycisphaerales bacterium]|nr:MAG: (2Fe-2S)-binding protein [Phycisphaerales bacterium]